MLEKMFLHINLKAIQKYFIELMYTYYFFSEIMSASVHPDPEPDTGNKELNLDKIKLEIKKRTEYKEGSAEQKLYKDEITKINNMFPDEGWRIPQGYKDSMNKLKKIKLSNIRKILKNDEGFEELKTKLPMLQQEYKELNNSVQTKPEAPTEPKKPNNANPVQKVYSLITSRTNAADKTMEEYKTKLDEYKTKLDEYNTKMQQYNKKNKKNEIDDIIRDIERLIPIYEPPIDKIPSGGKRRTRRRRASKKPKKSQKNQKKSQKKLKRRR